MNTLKPPPSFGKWQHLSPWWKITIIELFLSPASSIGHRRYLRIFILNAKKHKWRYSSVHEIEILLFCGWWYFPYMMGFPSVWLTALKEASYSPYPVDASEIRRENQLGCIKPVINNGISITNPNCFFVGFLNHQQYLIGKLCVQQPLFFFKHKIGVKNRGEFTQIRHVAILKRYLSNVRNILLAENNLHQLRLAVEIPLFARFQTFQLVFWPEFWTIVPVTSFYEIPIYKNITTHLTGKLFEHVEARAGPLLSNWNPGCFMTGSLWNFHGLCWKSLPKKTWVVFHPLTKNTTKTFKPTVLRGALQKIFGRLGENFPKIHPCRGTEVQDQRRKAKTSRAA